MPLGRISLEVVVSNEPNNYDIPMELIFDITRRSGQMKFLGLSEKADESDNDLTGLFDWTCQACNTANRDTVAVKPQQVFIAKWTCSRCSRVTLVRFRARAVAEWIAQHTLAVTGKSMDAPPEDPLAVACVAACGKRLQHRRRIVLSWVAVPVLAVILLLALPDMRRVRNSSASPWASANSATCGRGHESALATPSARMVGYWISERRDHVVHFSPVDPVLRTGTYVVVYRGDQQGKAVQFKVLHEETAGEQLVIRKENASDERFVVKHRGDEIAYRVQSEAAEVTFNVAKDGKSMTRLEILDGEPVMTVYYSAGDTGNP